jgi:hypothetical protein
MAKNVNPPGHPNLDFDISIPDDPHPFLIFSNRPLAPGSNRNISPSLSQAYSSQYAQLSSSFADAHFLIPQFRQEENNRPVLARHPSQSFTSSGSSLIP